jgi:colicin import membrane protein
MSNIVEYDPIETALADLRQRFSAVVFDTSTTKGLDEARKARADIREYRYGLEATREKLKAPVILRGKAIESEAKRLTAELLAIEEPIDSQIKSEEARREAARKEREEKEAKRIADIVGRINWITALPTALVGGKAEEIIATQESLAGWPMTADLYGEFLSQAQAALAATKETLQKMGSVALDMEAEQARLAQGRAELEAQRKADEAARAAQDEIDRKTRAEAQAKLDAEKKRLKEEGDRLAAQVAAAAAEEARQAAERKRIADAEAERQRAAEARKKQEEELARLRALHDERVAQERGLAESEVDALIKIHGICLNPEISNEKAVEQIEIIAYAYIGELLTA